ncbi:hypothetical protein JXQ70_06645 [bacterium]|nr:hypothetical protein [bacterium]
MPWCLACHEECDVITVDNGIGHYEYWGFPGVDRNECEVSDCCEAAFTEDEYELYLLDENGDPLDEETICNNHRRELGLPDYDGEDCDEEDCSINCPLM